MENAGTRPEEHLAQMEPYSEVAMNVHDGFLPFFLRFSPEMVAAGSCERHINFTQPFHSNYFSRKIYFSTVLRRDEALL